MAFTDGFKLIEEFQNFSQNDIPRLLKVTQQTHQSSSLLRWFMELESENQLDFVQKAVRAYCHILTSVKLAKAFFKILVGLPKKHQSIIEKEMKASFGSIVCQASTEDCHLKTLCLILDQNNIAKTASSELLCPISHIIKDRLSCPGGHEKKMKEDFGEIYHTVKICILCLQLHPEAISQLYIDSGKELSCLWREILRSLLILMLGAVSRDLSFLAGTAAAMAINLLPSCEEIASAYVGVIDMMRSGQDELTIGNMQVPIPVIRSCDTLPLLCIIKGLLVSAPRNLLCHPIKQKPLVLCVFPHIISICQGSPEYHYMAFQVLLLWFEKLDNVGILALKGVSERPSSTTDEVPCRKSADSVLPLADAGDYSNRFHQISVISSIHQKADFPSKSDEECQKSSEESPELSTCSSSNHRAKQSQPKDLESLTQTHYLSPSNEQSTYNCNTFSALSPVSLEDLTSNNLFSSSCPVLASTISCLWLNWDSPVDGVSEFAVNIFQRLMKIWSRCIQDGIPCFSDLCLNLMNRVMGMAWHSKARYRPMAVLLSHLNSTDTLVKFPALKEELMKCMTIHHLIGVATDVYKVFLQRVKIECGNKDSVTVWAETWMDTVLLGLTSSDGLQRVKTCTYWLPPTLKVIPDSKDILLENIALKYDKGIGSNKNKWLFAWITVVKCSRDLLNCEIEPQYEKYVQEALTSFDETVRSEVLLLLCVTLKRAEPVSKSEILWLKSFIPVNLRTDIPTFRHSLTTAIKKFIVRIRDSCVSAIRAKRTSEAYLSCGIEFIDWLYKLLMQSLAPGGSYQRRQTTFNIIEALLESLIHQASVCAKKGRASENSHILLKFARERGLWNFFSRSNFSTLLSCLEDGAEEIQFQSYKILMDYFPCSASFSDSSNPLPNDWHQQTITKHSEHSASSIMVDNRTICSLFTKALDLILSPKSYENNSGQLILSLILKKFVRIFNLKFDFDILHSDLCINSSKISVVKLDEGEHEDPCFLFINSLLQIVRVSVAAVQKDVAKQFKVHLIHGITECLSKCVEEIFKDYHQNPSTKWIGLLENIVSVNQEIILLMLDILAGGKKLEDCPSFADMGMALEDLISSGLDDQEEVATVSTDFQLLLSWCWINLKNSCSCLGEMAACSIQGNTCLLHLALINDIGNTFVRVLTTCRHRGAIEGCRSGFSQFCSVLLSCRIKDFSKIPERILEEILQSLSTNSLTASVSRRSAGLPIIIQTIVSNATRILGTKDMLLNTVDRLYEIASEPLPADYSQQRDLAQSHALNILKVIFCEASLSSHLMPLLSKVTILVIEGFDSPSWAIRNSATQLISTLVTRIFGQKKEQGGMTLEEFHSVFPDLHEFAYLRLQMYHSSKSLINPSLYLVLTLFSSLAMSPSHQLQEGERKSLQQILLSFTASPLYSLRKLSAQAYVSLCPVDCVDNQVREILRQIVTGQDVDRNSQHGQLLCVYYFVTTGFASHDMYWDFLTFLAKTHFLDEQLKRCSFTGATVMLILNNLLLQIKGNLDQPKADTLWLQLTSHIQFLCQTPSSIQLGNHFALTETLKTLTVLSYANENLYNQTVVFLCSLLESIIEDVRHAVLSCISLEEGSRFLENDSVKQMIAKNVLQESNPSGFAQSCQLLVRLQLTYESHSEPSWHSHISNFDTEEASHKLGQMNCVQIAIFLLEGIIIHSTSGSLLHNRIPMIGRCCQRLLEFSDPCVNEDLRMSAVRFLRITGITILDFSCIHQNDSILEEAVVSIVKSLLSLLQDPESEVRSETALFVSDLKGIPAVHNELAWELLSVVIYENLWWSDRLVSHLMQILFSSKELTSALQRCVTREQRLFEPETDSVISEPYKLKLWTFHTMQSLVRCEKLKSSSFLTTVTEVTSTELKEHLPYVLTNAQENLFFNVTSNPAVMSSLLGIILIDKLVVYAKSEVGHLGQDLHAQVEKLLQISSLHPMLKDIETNIQL